jgi:hypothetical protein
MSQNRCPKKSQKFKEFRSTCDFIIKVKEFIIFIITYVTILMQTTNKNT